MEINKQTQTNKHKKMKCNLDYDTDTSTKKNCIENEWRNAVAIPV